MKYNIDEIAKAVDAKFIQKASESTISLISIDSRQSYFNGETLFFAIVGERQNGHDFIEEVYEKGGRNFIIQDEIFELKNFPEANFLWVKNSQKALQNLASHHRASFRELKTIGITGSNGKTIVKEWLSQLLSENFKIVKSPASYNSQVGVPLSLWQINESHDLGIFEAGISQSREMEHLEKMISPQVGILTSIGDAHSENFKNITEKTLEKIKLFENCKKLILSADLENFDLIKNHLQSKNVKLISWTLNDNIAADYKFQIENKKDFTTLSCNDVQFSIKLSDSAFIENICTILTLIFAEKWKVENLQTKILELSSIKMRLELIKAENNTIIINDSYNFDFDSLKVALDFQNKVHHDLSKTLVLSDMLQQQNSDKYTYKKIATIVKDYPLQQIILIGEKISHFATLFKAEKVYSYTDTDDFINHLSQHNFINESFLLKGARKFKFEKISKELQQKSHSTVLEINLDHLIHNVNYFKSLLSNKKVKMMAMVKAFGYGSGGVEVAKILSYNKIDYLAVAYSDEGIDLRKAGIKTPIVVLHPEEDAYEKMIKNLMEPEIFNLRVLKKFTNVVQSLELNYPYPIHIKLDTGMHRLGFQEEELSELIDFLNTNDNIVVKSVFSHLAASDDESEKSFTLQQINRFKKMLLVLKDTLKPDFMQHILNSEGILNFPDASFDMVRLGIGMYGISSHPEHQKNLKNVSTLKTVISQIKTLKTGDVIGYTAKNKVSKPTRTATIPIGYAHGLSRKLGNGNGKVLINGSFAPYIGNICMDLAMIDISNVSCDEGDEVIIFGEGLSVQNIATSQKTIAYEVLSGISQRVKRTFLKE